jgi:phosphatidylserine decarboxylase
MDSCVVISYGKQVFRTRVICHSLNPTWDEKLLFHVRAYESGFKVQLTVLDWDTLSSNDYVRDAGFMVADLMADAPQRDERTELYGEEADGGYGMKVFGVSSSGKCAVPWEAKHNPVITFR